MTPEHELKLMELLETLSDTLIESSGSMRRKPIHGGLFGIDRYLIGSFLMVEKDLYAVSYYVLEAQTWLPVGNGDTQPAAMECARRFLSGINQTRYMEFVRGLAAKRLRKAEEIEKADLEERARQRAAQQPSIPKRRREIFEKSEGRCHYCATALTLDGKWHIEHKMPKALLGSNGRANLVASCVTCNLQKRDMTAEEFLAKRATA